MDSFTRQYLITALWSSGNSDDPDACEDTPLDELTSVDDLPDETVARAVADCDRFREVCGDLLEEHSDPDMGGRDFWLTRNGHGAGFWDGDCPLNGDRLTKICEEFGEADLYLGDDGKAYFL